MKSPSKGDWVSMCLDNLKDLQIESSFEDIEKMLCTQFKNILKEKVKSAAFIYIIEKQRSKGGEIEYTELKMSDYLLPNNELSIEEKIQVFSIRNKMDKNIPANFCSSQKIIICFCGNREKMEHVYKCKLLNEVEPSIKY